MDRIYLWLDDLRPAPEGWVHATTAPEAISILERGGVAKISLDHDLGEEIAGTGYQVACWVEEQAAYGTLAPLEWAIHSANTVGKANMTLALKSAERFWSSNHV